MLSFDLLYKVLPQAKGLIIIAFEVTIAYLFHTKNIRIMIVSNIHSQTLIKLDMKFSCFELSECIQGQNE